MLQDRDLYIVPLSHTNTEFGYKEDYSDLNVTAHRSWARISEFVRNLHQDPLQLIFYVDALPRLPRGIHNNLFQSDVKYLPSDFKNSPTFRFLKQWSDMGSQVDGPESLRLILASLALQRTMKIHPVLQEGLLEVWDKIMLARDRNVARHINNFLMPGKVGILLMGADHRVGSHLSPEIYSRVPQQLFEGQSRDFVTNWLGYENWSYYVYPSTHIRDI